MESILDYLDLLLSRPIKITDEPPKISKPKAVLVRLELNVDGEMYPTSQHYWVPRFLIRDNNYLGTDWKDGQKIFREIREKIQEGESNVYRIVMFENEQGEMVDSVRDSEKARCVRIQNKDGAEFEMWCPRSLIVNETLPQWFVEKMMTENDDRGFPRVRRVKKEVKKQHGEEGDIMGYLNKEDDDDDEATDDEIDELIDYMG